MNHNPRKAQLVFSAVACRFGLKHISPFPLLWVSTDQTQLIFHLFTFCHIFFKCPQEYTLCVKVSCLSRNQTNPNELSKSEDVLYTNLDCGGGCWSAAGFLFLLLFVLQGLCPRLRNTEKLYSWNELTSKVPINQAAMAPSPLIPSVVPQSQTQGHACASEGKRHYLIYTALWLLLSQPLFNAVGSPLPSDWPRPS